MLPITKRLEVSVTWSVLVGLCSLFMTPAWGQFFIIKTRKVLKRSLNVHSTLLLYKKILTKTNQKPFCLKELKDAIVYLEINSNKLLK